MRTSRALLITTAVLVSVVGLAGPAQAGTSGPGGASSEGGSASLTWTWAGPGSMNDIDLQVLDNRCDARGTYAQLVFERRPGYTPRTTPPRWNKIGCNGAQPYNDLTFSDDFDLVGFYVRSCTDSNTNNKADGGDNCGRSGTVPNPLAR